MYDIAFEKYYESICAKNPALRDSAKMTITIASFKAQLRQAFNAGHEQAKAGEALMDRIFGKGGLR